MAETYSHEGFELKKCWDPDSDQPDTSGRRTDTFPRPITEIPGHPGKNSRCRGIAYLREQVVLTIPDGWIAVFVFGHSGERMGLWIPASSNILAHTSIIVRARTYFKLRSIRVCAPTERDLAYTTRELLGQIGWETGFVRGFTYAAENRGWWRFTLHALTERIDCIYMAQPGMVLFCQFDVITGACESQFDGKIALKSTGWETFKGAGVRNHVSARACEAPAGSRLVQRAKQRQRGKLWGGSRSAQRLAWIQALGWSAS